MKEDICMWNRGTCYSRLDYIFISNSMLSKLVNAECDWSFETSDHAAVRISFVDTKALIKGPWIIKVNTTILDNPLVSKQIEEELLNMMTQADPNWNQQVKLEFLKVAIRSIFALN